MSCSKRSYAWKHLVHVYMTQTSLLIVRHGLGYRSTAHVGQLAHAEDITMSC